MRLEIRGGRVIDPGQGIDELMDVIVENGKVKTVKSQESRVNSRRTAVGGQRSVSGTQVIDATGKVVVPGLVDMHVHLREPGFEYKETIRSGAQAALAGGFTTICPMPNTDPINDNRSVVDFILRRAQEADLSRVYPIGAISKGSRGEVLADIGEMVEAGVVAISDDGSPVMNGELMRRALEYARIFGIPVISHCEDINLSAGGVMNEGQVATELGLSGIPSTSEEVMVARDIALAKLTSSRLHIAHVSSSESVRLIREAKARGIEVTAEVTPHHLTLTEESIRGYDTNYKVNPPLRAATDREALWKGLKDGTIDCIATDHAPHQWDVKNLEFDNAAFGMVGLETALPLILKLVEERVLSLAEAIAKMTINPSRILNINRGILSPGSDADITIFDPQKEIVVDPQKFKSKSRNTPFAGWNLKGVAIFTIVGGELKYTLDT